MSTITSKIFNNISGHLNIVTTGDFKNGLADVTTASLRKTSPIISGTMNRFNFISKYQHLVPFVATDLYAK